MCRARPSGVAWFDFAELCGRPLGAADYLADRDAFPHSVPRWRAAACRRTAQQARRFITLIDALYEHRVIVVIAADAPPDAALSSGAMALSISGGRPRGSSRCSPPTTWPTSI